MIGTWNKLWYWSWILYPKISTSARNFMIVMGGLDRSTTILRRLGLVVRSNNPITPRLRDAGSSATEVCEIIWGWHRPSMDCIPERTAFYSTKAKSRRILEVPYATSTRKQSSLISMRILQISSLMKQRIKRRPYLICIIKQPINIRIYDVQIIPKQLLNNQAT